MSYSFCLQKFESGDSVPFSFNDVVAALKPHGSVGDAGGWWEFTPQNEGICEVALISGVENEETTTGLSFERPSSSATLREIVFEPLAIPGTCFFEVDVTYVAARSDVAADLPPELLELCESGQVTMLTDASELPF